MFNGFAFKGFGLAEHTYAVRRKQLLESQRGYAYCTVQAAVESEARLKQRINQDLTQLLQLKGNVFSFGGSEAWITL
jgi:hypothetical protein